MKANIPNNKLTSEESRFVFNQLVQGTGSSELHDSFTKTYNPKSYACAVGAAKKAFALAANFEPDEFFGLAYLRLEKTYNECDKAQNHKGMIDAVKAMCEIFKYRNNEQSKQTRIEHNGTPSWAH